MITGGNSHMKRATDDRQGIEALAARLAAENKHLVVDMCPIRTDFLTVEFPRTLFLGTTIKYSASTLVAQSEGGTHLFEPSDVAEYTAGQEPDSPGTTTPRYSFGTQKDAYKALLSWRPQRPDLGAGPPQVNPSGVDPPSVGECLSIAKWDRCVITPGATPHHSVARKVPLDIALHNFLGILAFFKLTTTAREFLIDSISLMYTVICHRLTDGRVDLNSGCTLCTRVEWIAEVYSQSMALFGGVYVDIPVGSRATLATRLLLGSATCGLGKRSPFDYVPGYIRLMLESLDALDLGAEIVQACERALEPGADSPPPYRQLSEAHRLIASPDSSARGPFCPTHVPGVANLLYKYLRANPRHYLYSGSTHPGDATGVPFGGFLLLCGVVVGSDAYRGAPLSQSGLIDLRNDLRQSAGHHAPYTRSDMTKLLTPTHAPVVIADSGSIYVSAPGLCIGIISAAGVPLLVYFILTIVYSSSSSLGNLSSVFLLLSGVILGTGPAYMRRGWQYYDFLRFRIPAASASDANGCLTLFLFQHRDPTISTVRGGNTCYLPRSLRSQGGNIDSDEPVRVVDLLCSHAHVRVYVDPLDRFVLACEGGYTVLSGATDHLRLGARPRGLSPMDSGRLGEFAEYISASRVGARNVSKRAGRRRGESGNPPTDPNELLARSLGALLSGLGHATPPRNQNIVRPTMMPAPSINVPTLVPGYGHKDIERLRLLPLGHCVPVGTYHGWPLREIIGPAVNADYVNFAYSTLGYHERDYFLDRESKPLLPSRFAALVRALVDKTGCYPQHALHVVARYCTVVTTAEGVKRLVIPVYSGDTSKSIHRLAVYIAGGPAPTFYSPTACKGNVTCFKLACSIVGRGGPTLIGHVFQHVTNFGCPTVFPSIALALDNSPCIVAYDGLWEIVGHAPAGIVDVIHHYAMRNLPKADIIRVLTVSLYKASPAQIEDAIVPVIRETDIGKYGSFILDSKMATRLERRVVGDRMVARALYFASLLPARYQPHPESDIRCTQRSSSVNLTPYRALEYPYVPHLLLGFNTIVNGGTCFNSIVPETVAPPRTVPTRYRYLRRYTSHVTLSVSERLATGVTLVVHTDPRRTGPLPVFYVVPLVRGYTYYRFPYTRFRLLIYPEPELANLSVDALFLPGLALWYSLPGYDPCQVSWANCPISY